MKFLERTNISPILLRALTNNSDKYYSQLKIFLDEYPEQFDYQFSVTTLSSAPREKVLVKRHHDEIIVDPLYFYYTLIGSAIHTVLEENKLPEERVEMRLGKVITINGKRILIHGQLDLWTPENAGVIEDHKYTSAYAMGKDRADHEAQLNILRWLCKTNGIDVSHLRNNYLFRNWMESNKGQANYPQEPVVLEDKKLWKKKEIEDFIYQRAELHLKNQDVPDSQLTECTPEEQWESPIRYALYKGSSKRAWRVKDTLHEAEAELVGKEGYDIVPRGGYRLKCERYCLAKQFCSQYKPTTND